jgi:hypothetical protein
MGAQKESEIQRAIRLKLGQLDDLVIWRNETGAYAEAGTTHFLGEVLALIDDASSESHIAAARGMIRAALKRSQWVSYGLCKGSSDLVGILKPSGRFFALELKSKTGKTTDEQVLFLRLVNNMGGYGGVARSVEEALAHYHRAAAGLDAE